jgi:ketosteroid isomerase-like protein
MIEQCIENWHRVIRGQYAGGLDELLADDVVFYSPIVFTPQKGKELAKLYLNAAANTFTPGSSGRVGKDDSASSGSLASEDSKFGYSKEVLSGNHAILEFETTVGGKYVNGVDIITCNDEGKIIEFKVMIRPLQAVNLMHQQMATMLEKMKES